MPYQRTSYLWVPSLLDELPVVARTSEEVCQSTDAADKAIEFLELVDGFVKQHDGEYFCAFFLHWWSEKHYAGPSWRGQIFYANPNDYINRFRAKGKPVVVLNPHRYSDAKTAKELLKR